MARVKFFFFLFFLFFILISAFFLLSSGRNISAPEPGSRIIKINGTEIAVEIAETPEKMAGGLSGRKELAENHGMLFLFPESNYYSFWLKDTLIELDFIWLENNHVVEITENVKPEDFQPPRTLTPKNKVNAVLEVNAGFVQKHRLKVGDEMTIY